MSDPVNVKNQTWLRSKAQEVHDAILSLSHNRGSYTTDGYWHALINILNQHAIPKQTLIDVSASNDHVNNSSPSDTAKAVASNNQNNFNNPQFDGSVKQHQKK